MATGEEVVDGDEPKGEAEENTLGLLDESGVLVSWPPPFCACIAHHEDPALTAGFSWSILEG